MVWYVFYWIDNRRDALESLRNHAISHEIRYVPISKAHELPEPFKKLGLGLKSNNLLAVAYSPILFDRDAFWEVFSPNIDYELVYTGFSPEEHIDVEDWMDEHMTRKFPKGVNRMLYDQSPAVKELRSRRVRDQVAKETKVDELTGVIIPEIEKLRRDVAARVGEQFGLILKQIQDDYLTANKRMFIRWMKLRYYANQGKLTEAGREQLGNYWKQFKEEFSKPYRDFFYKEEDQYKDLFTQYYDTGLAILCDLYSIDIDALKSRLGLKFHSMHGYNVRHYLDEVFPVEHPGYHVLPIWDNAGKVEEDMLNRVLPWEQHLRNLATYSPAPRPIVVGLKRPPSISKP